MASTPDKATATMIENLARQTGKTLDAWVTLVRKRGLTKHGVVVKWLKSDHDVTHGYANLIAHAAFQSDAGSAASEDALVDAQYAGEKAGLRPLYDRLIGEVRRFGADVGIAPKKGYVSLRRSKQFALVQPSTKTRLDVGINLKGVTPAGRLEASGSFNAMVSHRVRVASAAEIDKELVGWLKAAYDKA